MSARWPPAWSKPRTGAAITPPYDLLAAALAELDRYAEALRVTEEALRLQNEVLRACVLARDAERRYSQSLLSLIPIAVLVTDAGGLVREVNPAARMLGRRPYRRMAHAILGFLPLETRQDFQSGLSAGGMIAPRRATFTPSRSHPFGATITVVPISDAAGERRLHWLTRPWDRAD